MKKRIITIGFLILSLIFSSTSLAQEPLEAYNISNTYFITQKLSIQEHPMLSEENQLTLMTENFFAAKHADYYSDASTNYLSSLLASGITSQNLKQNNLENMEDLFQCEKELLTGPNTIIESDNFTVAINYK